MKKLFLMVVASVFLFTGVAFGQDVVEDVSATVPNLTTGTSSDVLHGKKLPCKECLWNLNLDFTTGSAVGTITLSVSYDGTKWFDVETFTADSVSQWQNSEKKARYKITYSGTNYVLYRMSY